MCAAISGTGRPLSAHGGDRIRLRRERIRFHVAPIRVRADGAAALGVDERVARDGEQPAREALPLPVALAAPDHGEPGFLMQFVGALAAGPQRVPAPDGPAPAGVERLEGAVVPGPPGGHELRVRVAGAIVHAASRFRNPSNGTRRQSRPASSGLAWVAARRTRPRKAPRVPAGSAPRAPRARASTAA